MATPRGTDKAKVIQVIVTESLIGDGTKENPCRILKQFWDFDGNLLAKSDEWKEEATLYEEPAFPHPFQ